MNSEIQDRIVTSFSKELDLLKDHVARSSYLHPSTTKENIDNRGSSITASDSTNLTAFQIHIENLKTLTFSILEEKKQLLQRKNTNCHETPAVTIPPESFWKSVGEAISTLNAAYVGETESESSDLLTMEWVKRCLELIRNLVAGPVETNQLYAREFVLKSTVELTCKYLSSESVRKAHLTVIHMAMQMISNVCTGNTPIQTTTWDYLCSETLLIPLYFQSLDEPSFKFGLILILNCTQSIPETVEMLTNGAYGRQILEQILQVCESHIDTDDTFHISFTIIKNWLSQDTFSLLWNLLLDTPKDLSQSRMRLLKLLDGVEQSRSSTSSTETIPGFKNEGIETLRCLLEILMACTQEISRMVTFDSTGTLHDESIGCTVLLLHIFISVFGKGRVSLKVKEDLIRNGMPVTLTALLKITETLTQGRKANPIIKQGDHQEQSPLYMLKSDLLHAIANLLYECPLAQDEFRECGGLPVLLSHCRIDDENPLMREYALFAVRNMLLNNPVNQEIVRGLEPKQVVREEDLDRLGVEVELDERGRLKFLGGSK